MDFNENITLKELVVLNDTDFKAQLLGLTREKFGTVSNVVFKIDLEKEVTTIQVRY